MLLFPFSVFQAESLIVLITLSPCPPNLILIFSFLVQMQIFLIQALITSHMEFCNYPLSDQGAHTYCSAGVQVIHVSHLKENHQWPFVTCPNTSHICMLLKLVLL